MISKGVYLNSPVVRGGGDTFACQLETLNILMWGKKCVKNVNYLLQLTHYIVLKLNKCSNTLSSRVLQRICLYFTENMENEADTEQSSSLTEKSVLSSHTYPKHAVASHPNPSPPVLHSSNPSLHSHSHPQGLHFSGFSADTAHPHPFRPYTLHPSPLARTSSNSSLCSVLTPEKMKSIISGIYNIYRCLILAREPGFAWKLNFL